VGWFDRLRWDALKRLGKAKCPAHTDENPSLDITEGKNGKPVFTCRAGCGQDAVLAALRAKGWWPEPKTKDNGSAKLNGASRGPKQRITATYWYHLEDGTEHLQQVRLEPGEDGKPKTFRSRYSDGNGEWVWKLPPTNRYIPYRLPELTEALAQGRVVVVVEGEKDVATAAKQLGITATCNAGGAGKWRREHSRYLADADVVIIPDDDDPGRSHAELVASLLQGIAARVRVLTLPGATKKGFDLTDWVEAGGTAEQLWALVEAAPDWTPAAPSADTAANAYKDATTEAKADGDPNESRIAELASLAPLKYASRRKEAAKAIGIPAAMLDKLVAAERKATTDAEAQPAHWEVEPWPEPVDGAALLDSLVNVFVRYAVLPEYAREALTLWVAHAWALDSFQCSPFATMISPTKRCGKSRVLAILKWLSPRSELAASISPAAVFRYIEQERPTLLMDEADRTMANNEELQGILNGSHKRVAAYCIRCEGDDNKPRRFSTWAPKAIATISKLADTLRDRSIIVEMRRKLPSEKIERWNEDDTAELATLRRKLLRWTEDNAAALAAAFPDDPAGMDDRAADNWRPLIAIADAAGGNWPEMARKAAVALSGGRDEEDVLVQLLTDIKGIFELMPQADWIGSAPLAGRLVELDDSPWQEWKHGKPITATGVARLLKRARIAPNRDWGKGRYLKSAFEDAWERYLA
jgi:hypothetical protein